MKSIFSCPGGVLALAAPLVFALAGPAAANENVTGAGASFPAPLYAKWASEYHKATGEKVNYQSVGSSAGIRQVDARTVDFGASDMPLKDEDLKAKGLVQFPTVIGGVIPVVHIDGIKPGELKLDGQVLGDIYLGRITKWNDPAIVALNGGLKLPDATISPVRRADGSGTTFLFTSYRSKANADWKTRVGDGTAVNWPTGAGGKGNEGVATFVNRLPNSIGYVEYAYVKQNRMTFAQLRNAAGNFVAPDENAFKAAAAGADWSRTFHQVLTNQPGNDAWPITGATFILMHEKPEEPEKAAAALKFFDWAFNSGDTYASTLSYVPMPGSVKAAIRDAWNRIKAADGKAVLQSSR